MPPPVRPAGALDSSFDSSINDGALSRTWWSAGAVVVAQHLLDAIEHELTRIILQPARADRGVLYRQILTDQRQRNSA